MNRTVEIIEEVAPALKDAALVLILCKLIIDVLKLNGFGIECICHLTDAICTHALVFNGFLRRVRQLAVIPCLGAHFGDSFFFFARELWTLAIFLLRFSSACFCALNNLLHLFLCIDFLLHGGVEVIRLIRPVFGANKACLIEMGQQLFERLSIFLIHSEQKKRHHGQNHHHSRQRRDDSVLQKQIKRHTDQCAASKADDLPLGQVKEQLGFDFRQVLRDVDFSAAHIVLLSQWALKMDFATLLVLNREKQSSTV